MNRIFKPEELDGRTEWRAMEMIVGLLYEELLDDQWPHSIEDYNYYLKNTRSYPPKSLAWYIAQFLKRTNNLGAGK